MERLIDQFHAIVREFRLKRHNLLDYHNNKFDRDYVEFNVKVCIFPALLRLLSFNFIIIFSLTAFFQCLTRYLLLFELSNHSI